MRPREDVDALALARQRLADVPQLVPVVSHRYLPAVPAPEPAPVFSVQQTDVIHYGADLADYLRWEFGGSPLRPVRQPQRVPFWSDLADGVEDVDL